MLLDFENFDETLIESYKNSKKLPLANYNFSFENECAILIGMMNC